MRKIWLPALLLLVLFGSCTTMKISNVQYTRSTVSARSLGEFEITVPVREWLGVSGGPNILNITAARMDKAIKDAVMDEVMTRGGDAAVDVTIVYKSKLGNLILNSITALIYAPATAVVTGTIVEYF